MDKPELLHGVYRTLADIHATYSNGELPSPSMEHTLHSTLDVLVACLKVFDKQDAAHDIERLNDPSLWRTATVRVALRVAIDHADNAIDAWYRGKPKARRRPRAGLVHGRTPRRG